MRELMDQYLSGETPARPPLFALGESLSARLGNMSRAEMQADAGHWAANQSKIKQLLALDAMAVGSDIDIVANACDGDTLNVEGNLAQQIEALSRLCQTSRSQSACLAFSVGPANLAKQLFSDEAEIAHVKTIMTELIEKLCEPRPDLLLLREQGELGQRAITMPQRKAYSTIKNMAAYYDVPLVLYLENYHQDQLQALVTLKLPFLWLGCDSSGKYPDPSKLAELAENFQGLGLPINFCDTEQALAQAQAYRQALPDGNYLLCSAGELDRDSDLEALIELSTKLSA